MTLKSRCFRFGVERVKKSTTIFVGWTLKMTLMFEELRFGVERSQQSNDRLRRLDTQNDFEVEVLRFGVERSHHISDKISFVSVVVCGIHLEIRWDHAGGVLHHSEIELNQHMCGQFLPSWSVERWQRRGRCMRRTYRRERIHVSEVDDIRAPSWNSGSGRCMC